MTASQQKNQNGFVAPGPSTDADTVNPLYGVHGWLKFFVVVNLYIAPVLFVLRHIMAWMGFMMLAEDAPGIIPVGLIETGVGGFLMVKWINIARRLRDIVPAVVQEARTWLMISLGWTILSTPLAFISGLDVEDVMLGAIKQILGGIISFAIWYSYFNVSKRVRATYPDWDK